MSTTYISETIVSLSRTKGNWFIIVRMRESRALLVSDRLGGSVHCDVQRNVQAVSFTQQTAGVLCRMQNGLNGSGISVRQSVTRARY